MLGPATCQPSNQCGSPEPKNTLVGHIQDSYYIYRPLSSVSHSNKEKSRHYLETAIFYIEELLQFLKYYQTTSTQVPVNAQQVYPNESNHLHHCHQGDKVK